MSSPTAPTITSAVLGNQSMSVYFTQGDLGGGNVVKYMYSLNGSEYADAVEPTSPIFIGALTNGTVYSVSLIVVTDAETANFSVASDTLPGLIPYTAPDAPTISSISLGDGYMSISIADGLSTGGYDLSAHQYSIDGGVSYTDVILTANPIELTGLTNGEVYTVSVKSVSLAPDNNVSEASVALTAIPYTAPDAPTIIAIDASNACLVVHITDGASTGGYALNGYEYSVDGGDTFLAANELVSPVVITGLTNNTLYSVSVKTVSSAPTNNVSSASNTINAMPYSQPEPPTITNIDAGNGLLTVNFTDGGLTGGYDISGYLYSIDGGATFVEAAQHISPLTIGGLENGTAYTVSMKTVTIATFYNVSVESNSLVETPYTAPGAPTISSIVGSDGTLTINFSNGSTGGYPLSTILYSVDDGQTYTDALNASSPIIISGLTNGTQYNVYLKAVSTAPTDNISLASFMSGIPYTASQPPTITSVDGSNTTLTMQYTDGTDGGYQIKKRQYTLNNGTTYVDFNHTIPSGIKADSLDELVLKKGNASLKSSIKADIAFFPMSSTVGADGTFVVSGQSDAIKNGTYKITASSYYGAYSPKNLLDSNLNTIWSADWSTNAHRYLGNGNGTYSGIVTTSVVSVGSVGGEWFQIQFPSQIAMSTYSLQTYENFLERYPNEFYVVGSNDGTTWNMVDHKTNQTITNFNAVTYSVNSTTSYLYFRFIMVSMPNGYNTSNDLNLSNIQITTKIASEHVVLPEFTTNSIATSISAWVKTASFSKVIMDLANGSNLDNIKLLTNSNGYLSLYVENGGQTNTVALSSASIATNQWKHIAVNIENVSGVATYTSFIDGIQTVVATQKIYPSSTLRTSNYLFKSNNGDAGIEGNLDDVRIYGRALEVSEVQSLVLYENQTVFPLNTDAALLVYEPLDYVNDAPFTISGLTNGVIYPVNMREITYAPTNSATIMSADSSGIPYTAPSAPTIYKVTATSSGFDVSFSLADTGGYPIAKYQYTTNNVDYVDVYKTTSPLNIIGLVVGQMYNVRIRAISEAPLNNVSQESNLVSGIIPYSRISPPTITSIDCSNTTLIVHYTDGDVGGYQVKKRQYTLDHGTTYIDLSLAISSNIKASKLDEVVFKKGNASLTTDTNSVSIFPKNVYVKPDGTFILTQTFLETNSPAINSANLFTSNSNTLTGQTASYRNGAYLMSASTEYDSVYSPGTFSAFHAFNLSTSTNGTGVYWHSNGGVYNDTTGAYVGSAFTQNVNGLGTVNGEWIQIKFPYKLLIKSVGLLPRQSESIFVYRMPNSMVIVGSDDGINWNVLYSQTSASSAYAYTTVTTIQTPGVRAAYQYIRLIARTSMPSPNQQSAVINIQQLNYIGNIFI